MPKHVGFCTAYEVCFMIFFILIGAFNWRILLVKI